MIVPRDVEVVIRTLEGKAPMHVVAEVLDLKAPQVAYRRQVLGIQGRKGANSGKFFVWKVDRNTFQEQAPRYHSKFSQVWRQYLNQVAAEACGVEPEEGDASIVDVLQESPTELVGPVLCELFGISEKALCRLRKALDVSLSSKEAAHIAAEFYSSEQLPEVPVLSTAQRRRMRTIARRLRREKVTRATQRMTLHADEVLASMQAAKAAAIGEDTYVCRGAYCDSGEWPRTADCYYLTTDTPDGWSYVCKYCALMTARARGPQRRNEKPTVHPIRDDEVNLFLPIVKAVDGKVPTAYVLALLGVTKKQLGRLRVLAELSLNVGKGQEILHRWRVMDDEDFPAIDGLDERYLPNLRTIWREDKAAWLEEVEEKDRKLLEEMLTRYAEMEQRRDPDIEGGPLACVGGCEKNWWQVQYFFPNKAGSYKHWCRHCNRKRLRQGY